MGRGQEKIKGEVKCGSACPAVAGEAESLCQIKDNRRQCSPYPVVQQPNPQALPEPRRFAHVDPVQRIRTRQENGQQRPEGPDRPEFGEFAFHDSPLHHNFTEGMSENPGQIPQSPTPIHPSQLLSRVLILRDSYKSVLHLFRIGIKSNDFPKIIDGLRRHIARVKRLRQAELTQVPTTQEEIVIDVLDVDPGSKNLTEVVDGDEEGTARRSPRSVKGSEFPV